MNSRRVATAQALDRNPVTVVTPSIWYPVLIYFTTDHRHSTREHRCLPHFLAAFAAAIALRISAS